MHSLERPYSFCLVPIRLFLPLYLFTLLPFPIAFYLFTFLFFYPFPRLFTSLPFYLFTLLSQCIPPPQVRSWAAFSLPQPTVRGKAC